MGGLIAFLVVTIIFILLGFALKGKRLWPKIVFLSFAVVLLSLAGFFGILIHNINAAHVEAKVITIEEINEQYYKLECEYTFKNKTYRTYLEAIFYEKPDVGSKINVQVSNKNPKEINGGDSFHSGDGLYLAILFIGIFIFGGIGIIIFIPTTISLIRYIIRHKNNRTKQAPPLL